MVVAVVPFATSTPARNKQSVRQTNYAHMEDSQSDVVEGEAGILERTFAQMANLGASATCDRVVAMNMLTSMRVRNGEQWKREGKGRASDEG